MRLPIVLDIVECATASPEKPQIYMVRSLAGGRNDPDSKEWAGVVVETDPELRRAMLLKIAREVLEKALDI